ncbi:MAG: Nucleoside-diphosphate-sugar epimerase [Candidatus Woesebacteria bacterium GW2011_GWB1_38_5b]|uniref:Nucleoside-diphosphate-sugar epimerase n=1 Tax=Candidatus Woesebacteria bacterium GW2011_GWB1_38_5b TaxID=1618569 RepID=A0A0G0KJQ9_9BACT|nr:MAG: Nucleoside-diphosphate-sugar epimerase [Candidatus Woesebacteria bacterium GW2011_GWB1_38_5b]
MGQVTKVTTCRICKSQKLNSVFSFGSTPLANSFLSEEDLSKPEPFFPLELNFCENCGLLQLAHVVSPDLLFKKYLYVSSTSNVFVEHFVVYAKEVYDKFSLNDKSLVIDIGSNDGILLAPFKKLGVKVLGVDPAQNIAKEASKKGLKTLSEYFTEKTAKKISQVYGRADVITANNVFAHTDNIDELVSGVKILLKSQGVFIIEFPYLVDMLQKNLFDLVYHEHLSYLSIRPLVTFFNNHQMKIFDVKRVSSHGGSVRVFVALNSSKYKISSSVKQLIEEEKRLGLGDINTYKEFTNHIKVNSSKLSSLLDELKADGKIIAGYGAPAKGNTLLNYFNIGKNILDYIVDDSPLKQGLYTPGTHISIVSSEKLKQNPPDYLLILAWNFAEPIMKKLSDYGVGGGKFIVPVPEPLIVANQLTVADSIVESDLDHIIEGIKKEAGLLEGKTILISGGSGFLGSYFTKIFERLNQTVLKNPCRVISIDNYITGSPQKNFLGDISDDNIEFVYHDIRLPMFIQDNIDFVIHAAGLASPFYYQKYPLETIEAAVTGAKNLLEMARSRKIESFLFFSSSEIYGNPDPKYVPTPETYEGRVSSVGPRACYDESKRLTETICTVYNQKFGIPIKIVRPFNVYGPGMKADDYRVVPMFLSKGLAGEDLPVHGTGKQTRTFCYVSDAMIGFFKVLLSGKPNEAYNIGSGSPEVTMLQLAGIIAKHLGNGVKAKEIDYPSSYPAGEPQRRCPDLTKARTELDYKATVSLEDGLKRSILWFRSKYNR